jgi:hypothetical protein
VEINQAGSIPATVIKIENKFGVSPVAECEATYSDGELFWRPFYTREQVSLILSVQILEVELSEFKSLRAAIERLPRS